jgi:gas vesicle protein
MKLSDIRELSKDDILSAMGLASKPTTSERLLGMLSIFGVGLLVGAGTALLLAPKSGQDLREDLGQRIRKLRSDESDSTEHNSGSSDSREART